MIFFVKNDKEIEKYQVVFDIEKLKTLRKEIIDNCSYIEHKEYDSDYSPRFTKEIIKNFKSTPTGEKKEKEETRGVYLYSYDEYKPPHLVKLIDQLLNGNIKALDEINNYDISTKSALDDIDDSIESVNQEFNKISPENITKKKKKLIELEDLLKAKELNKEQQSIGPYYNQLIGLIKIELVGSILISEISKVEDFLEIKLSNQVEISNSKDKPNEKALKPSDQLK